MIDTVSPKVDTPAPEELVPNVISSKSIGEAFWSRVRSHPDEPLLRYATAPHASATRVWKRESYRLAAPSISRIAHFLARIGVSVGTPVGVISHTRPEWVYVDLAIQSLGAVTVSIYQSLPAHEAGYILYDSGAQIIFIENEEQLDKVRQLATSPCPIPEREKYPAIDTQLTLKHIISFEPLVGAELPKEVALYSLGEIVHSSDLPETPPPLPDSLTRESLSSLVYTSGTTGPPKGVIQRHGNHLSNVYQACDSKVFPPHGSLMLYLPLAHSFARLAYYAAVLSGAELVMPAVIDHRTSKVDLASVARDIRESDANVLPSVPRLFEKMAATLQAKSMTKGLQSFILRLCIKNALEVYELERAKKIPSLIHQVMFNGLKPIRDKIKKQLFGAQFSHGISGGAKLDPQVNRFFDALGITICEGYGLTETCVATHVNRTYHRKIGTVGTPFTGVEVKISTEDGEIILRGPNVTTGYHNRPAATAESWTDDGWFRTGDIGSVDSEGFLTITDRKKELIVTAGGKKIPPQSIEALFKRVPFISQPFLFGEGKPFCVMLFTLNEVELKQILAAKGVPLNEGDRLASLPLVRQMLQAEVNRVNTQIASFESIKAFDIVPEDFTIENGLLTPTLKVRRKKVVERYRDTIEALYRSLPGA
jgi:long-chain acyl-CoA synthetase